MSPKMRFMNRTAGKTLPGCKRSEEIMRTKTALITEFTE
jgi:hypothetical protein